MKILPELILLIDKLNDELESKSDSGMSATVTVEYGDGCAIIEWFGRQLWTSDNDPDQSLEDIEAEIREEMSSMFCYMRCVSK